MRAALSGTGIAIGIAIGMVAVLGISASSQAALLRQLDRLGTNLFTVAPGQTLGGADATLLATATGMGPCGRRRPSLTCTWRCTAATASPAPRPAASPCVPRTST